MAPPATEELDPRASARTAIKAAVKAASSAADNSQYKYKIPGYPHHEPSSSTSPHLSLASSMVHRTSASPVLKKKLGSAAAPSTAVPYDDDAASPYAMRDLTRAIEETAAEGRSAAKADADDEEDSKPPRAAKRYRLALMAWESLHSIAVGGVAPHLTELAAGLERRGHEVHVYVRSGAGQEPYQLIDGVHVHRISFDLSSDFVQEITNMCNAMVHFMLETESFMNAQFDAVHCHDWLAAPALTNIKHHHGRKCIFTVHSTEYGRCGNNIYGGQSARIRAIEQDAISCADRVIAVSGVLCDEVKAHYQFDWEKLRCVYNGINCLRYDGALWDPAEVRAMYGVGPLDPMVLTVGRLVVQKGVDILVEAIPSVLAARPDAKFVIVGDGHMKDSIMARANELGVSGSVRFTGSMGGQNLVNLFKATDLVAIPSRNEPFGIVVLEAWASSKPVVATKSGGPREFVWHDNDGFVVDTTADGIAWGICAMFANFSHMKYMGDRGRVKAAYQFSWDNIAENTNNVYDELLGDHPGLPDEDAIKETTREKQGIPLSSR